MNNVRTNYKEEVKALLCKLPGIINCSMVCDDANNIEELHILATTGRNVKQLVRDIQSAISAKFNISVDYKKISIAQINENEFKEARLRIESIAVKNVENLIEAVVNLSYEDKLYEGRSTKVKSRSNRAKAVAEATLGALEGYAGLSGVFYLEGLERVLVAGKEMYVSVVGYSYDNVEEVLTGSSIISLDENESAVKAVLAAVNRKVNNIG